MSYYDQRFSIDFRSTADVEAEDVVERMARRNLLVHNNGVVNEIYLASTGACAPRLGDRLEVTEEYFMKSADDFSRLAQHATQTLESKFGCAPEEEAT